jgi:hypothetical protein
MNVIYRIKTKQCKTCHVDVHILSSLMTFGLYPDQEDVRQAPVS